MSDSDSVDALIRLLEYERKLARRARWVRRAKKAGLIAAAPIAGPLVGQVWAEQEERGWS